VIPDLRKWLAEVGRRSYVYYFALNILVIAKKVEKLISGMQSTGACLLLLDVHITHSANFRLFKFPAVQL